MSEKHEVVTVVNLDDEHERIRLPNPHFKKNGQDQGEDDRYLMALYVGPRSGRRFVKRKKFSGFGSDVYELSGEDYLELCEEMCTAPVNFEATEV